MARKKAVVITGGAGFLGSHLSDRFIQEGMKVICVDNLITGSMNNIAHLQKNKDFKFIKHDVSKELRFADKVDYVLHFASPASPVDYLMHPIPTLKVGALGTHNTLGLAKFKKARYLIASTSEVYGDPLQHPQKETYWGNVNPIGPRGVYDEAKRFAEAITMAYKRYHNVDTRIVRIFNTYGPRMRINDGRVVPNFIYQAFNNKAITVYGNGKQTRSFCYYSDLIEGITRLLYSDNEGPVNIGNPDEFSILEFAKLVIELSGSKSTICFEPLPTDDPKQRKPDITLAKKLLNWEPKVKLKQGLEDTIKWFKDNMQD
ncbi:MAG: NAD-dependent dehydratase [Omnitrophica WOR_2 bacterium RIFOXYB2_FULL_38_16]|nr:MAG: NAD-dependent dehydratase [Omnitrophica WOR_2 bacterium GWA2_37_7]OGX58321.1 MAG: NAD-dependent dehydratase [Omnitrophica WOR_2 bacterium RIFOXYB2_FULL_38_16]OGX59705.1 MAG: NAD-dependent dehydratase [Omnitrophica WOR_2 bacterium RIFOXYC2_FULL_38_12]HBG61356.1 NAD-dependent dehydratase [Candidatus Omnitrophota bacterium]